MNVRYTQISDLLEAGSSTISCWQITDRRALVGFRNVFGFLTANIQFMRRPLSSSEALSALALALIGKGLAGGRARGCI